MILALDSNVFIYILDKHPEFFEPARAALRRASEQPAVISTLVYMESLAKLTGRPFDESRRWLELLCEQAQIKVVPISIELAVLAARLRARHKQIKPIDAIHLATALYSGASIFITNDLALTKLSIKDLKISSL